MNDQDLDRLKGVPLELWKRCADVAATMAPEAPCVIELRAALTPKLRTRAEVDAEMVIVEKEIARLVIYNVRSWGGDANGEVTLRFMNGSGNDRRLSDLCGRYSELKNEPTAPDPAPAPAIDPDDAALARDVDHMRELNRLVQRLARQLDEFARTPNDPAPAPSEREQELQREVERLRGLAKKAKRELERGWSWTPQAITILEEALRHD